MKKRIFAILLVFALAFNLVACTPNFKAYMSANEKVSNWKGSESKGNITYNIKVKNPEKDSKEEVNVDLKAELTAKTMGQDKAEINFDFDVKSVKESLKKSAKEINEDPKEVDTMFAGVPDKVALKMFIDKQTIYVNKDALQIVYPQLADIKEEYIAIASNVSTLNPKAMTYLYSQEFRSDIIKLMENSLKDFKPVVDYKVEGNTFTLSTTSDDILNDIANGTKALNKNWDAFSSDATKVLEKMGMPLTDEQKEEFKKAKGEFDAKEIETALNQAKEFLKGSKISEKSTFEDNKYTSNIKLDLNLSTFANAKVEVNTESVKNDDVKITLPTSVKKFTQEEFEKMVMPEIDPVVILRVNGETVDFEDSMPMIKNDRTMVPFRALLEKLGSKVEFDQKTKTVTATKDDQKIELVIGKDVAKVNGKEVKLDAPAFIENDRTFIPARFISENLGYKVKFEKENNYVSFVDVYNIKDEELPKAIEKAEKAEMEKFEKEMKAMEADEKQVGITKEAKEEKEVKEDKKVEEKAKDAAKLLFNFVK